MGYRQIWHIEDEPASFQNKVWALIAQAEESGIQLTPLDFCELDGLPTIDGMYAPDWLNAMMER